MKTIRTHWMTCLAGCLAGLLPGAGLLLAGGSGAAALLALGAVVMVDGLRVGAARGAGV